MSADLSRRRFIAASTAAAASLSAPPRAASSPKFSLNYIVASAMYGTTPLAEVLAEVPKTGTRSIDIWPRVHADHREQIAAMGLDSFAELLAKNRVSLGALTHYVLGPLHLAAELPVAKQFACNLIVTGAKGAPVPKDPASTREAVHAYLTTLKPHLEKAADHGVTLAIENHAQSLIHSPDSIRWLADAAPHNLGIALAPHHLPQDPDLQAALIRDLGPKLVFFYAQQHGKGSKDKLPKEDELLQLPGRGPLDFAPLIAALKTIDFKGFTEIFMHPVPRGIPILEPTAAVTAEIIRTRDHLNSLIK